MKRKKNISCTSCDYEDNAIGYWKIIIFKKYRGSYGKKFNYVCHDCLSNALTGYHTGGGLVGSVIKKIKRIKISKRVEEKWEKNWEEKSGKKLKRKQLLCWNCGSNNVYAIDSYWECANPYTIYFCPVCKHTFIKYHDK